MGIIDSPSIASFAGRCWTTTHWNRGRWSDGLLRRLTALTLMLGVGAALVTGYGVAKANLMLGMAPAALLCLLLLALFPGLILWLTIALGLLISGLVKLYVPTLDAIRWGAVPLAALLAFHVLLAHLNVRQSPVRSQALPLILWWSCAVLASAALTIVINSLLTGSLDPVQMARGLKGYFQVWGLMLGLALLAWPQALMRRTLPWALLAIALLQWPFVLHQYLVLVPQRAGLEVKGLVPVDVIAGTFGAEENGGGANSMLALYMFVVLAGVTALWQNRLLSGKWLALLAAVLMAPLLANGAKVSVIYALVLFLVLFGRDVLTHPARFVGIGLVAALAMVAMLFAYSLDLSDKRVGNWTDVITNIYQTNLADDQQNRGAFTRAGALRYWFDQHIPKDPVGALVGHGLYESRDTSGGFDLWDASDPSLGIKNTAISALLWDVGILGLSMVLGLMIAGYVTASRLARSYRDDPWMEALFRGAKTTMALIFLSLGVKSYFSYQLAYQTLLLMLLGWLAYWDQHSRRPDTRVEGL